MKHSRGSCVCGAVRYELSAEPIALFCYHCTECQTASGSSFVLALKMPYGGLTVAEGEAGHTCDRKRTDKRGMFFGAQSAWRQCGVNDLM